MNPNSALWWLPGARATANEYDEVNVPRTKVIEFDFMQSLPLLEGEPATGFPWGDLDSAACELGWPVFIRTDLSSVKHGGLSAIRADHADAVPGVVKALIRDSAMKMMRPAAFLVREWITVDSKFTAFDGLPIGVEFRLFATPDEHLCTHYYWPEESIENPSPNDPIVYDEREEMASTLRPHWMKAAAQMAAFEADFIHGVDNPDRAWSVDFARDGSGDWWLIDMALAEDSWHPECDQKTALKQ